MKKMLILLLSLALLFSFAGCSQNNPSLPDDPDKDLSTENNDQSSIDNKDDSNGENGENSQYIFALPPRYNFAYPKGFEEVEKIIKGSPLTGTSPGANSSPGDSSEAPVDN